MIDAYDDAPTEQALNDDPSISLSLSLSSLPADGLSFAKLLRFFVSQTPGSAQIISHVVGCDHRIAQETAGKTHLALLKLLQVSGTAHSEMLYVGSDSATVQHLVHIDVCKAHLCETKGLTQSAFQGILDTYF